MNIKEAVAAKIASSGNNVAERVVDLLVEEIIAKRVKQITAAYTELDRLHKDFRRLKADVVSYDSEGVAVSSLYSKKLTDERKNINARMEKLTKAIDAALENNNWDLINKLGDNKNSNDESTDS